MSRIAPMRVFRQVPEQPYQLTATQTRRHLVGSWSTLDALYQIRPKSLDPAHFQRKQRYFRMGIFNMTVMHAYDLHAHHHTCAPINHPIPPSSHQPSQQPYTNHYHTSTPLITPTIYHHHLTFPTTHAREQCCQHQTWSNPGRGMPPTLENTPVPSSSLMLTTTTNCESFVNYTI